MSSNDERLPNLIPDAQTAPQIQQPIPVQRPAPIQPTRAPDSPVFQLYDHRDDSPNGHIEDPIPDSPATPYHDEWWPPEQEPNGIIGHGPERHTRLRHRTRPYPDPDESDPEIK